MSDKKEKSRKVVLPQPNENETVRNYAYAALRAMWLASHPGKTAEDFDKQYAEDLKKTQEKKNES